MKAAATTEVVPHTHRGLKRRVVYVFIHALIPLVALSIYIYLGVRETTINTAKKDATYVSEIEARLYQEKITATKNILRAFSIIPEIVGGQAEPCNRLLASLLKEFPSYDNFGVIDRNGFVYCSGLPLTKKVDAKDISWYQETLKNESFSAGLYQIGKITGQESVNFGYPVAFTYPIIENGKTSKIIFAALKLDWIKETASNFALPEGSTITVMDRGGTVLARFPDGAKYVGINEKDDLLVKTILAGSDKGSLLGVGFDGVERYYSYVKVNETVSNAEFYLYIGVPRSALTQAANKSFAADFVIILIVIAITVVLAVIDWKKFADKDPTSS